MTTTFTTKSSTNVRVPTTVINRFSNHAKSHTHGVSSEYVTRTTALFDVKSFIDTRNVLMCIMKQVDVYNVIPLTSERRLVIV